MGMQVWEIREALADYPNDAEVYLSIEGGRLGNDGNK